ncbi:MAG: hypothetical protein ACLR9W_09065 [Enterobacter hormaechei]
MNRPFHLMAKSVSYQCNIACDYCFYLEKEHGTLKPRQPSRHMDDTTLEAFVRQYIAANPGPEVEFTWQGGEPTLAGIEFTSRPCGSSKNMPPKTHHEQYSNQWSSR